jgi:dethiobiotin synthetase
MKSSQILFITGTDTGVGKTVFAALATVYLRQNGFRVAGLKPLCSGGRDDARTLQAAAGKALSLAEVNPWYFRAPLAPVLAARKEKRQVRLREVVTHIRRIARRFEVVVVEGAGGLLSPLGEGFDSRDLIKALNATPIIVCANKLGAVNQVRLVVEALPRAAARNARIVLVNPKRPDAVSETNLELLKEFVAPSRLRVMPWVQQR